MGMKGQHENQLIAACCKSYRVEFRPSPRLVYVVMERVLSTLDHLERDITDFLNRKTKLNNFKNCGDKTDENFNIKGNCDKYKSLNALDVTGPYEGRQVEQRRSLGENSTRRHEVRNCSRNKRQGMLFPTSLDVTKIAEDFAGVDTRNMDIISSRYGEHSSPLGTSIHQNRTRKSSLKENGYHSQWSNGKTFSNIILEMQPRAGMEEMTNKDKYELRVRMINDHYDRVVTGTSEYTSERIIKDIRLPVPEGLTRPEEDSLLHVYRKLCGRSGSEHSDDLPDFDPSDSHQVINEYFV